MITELEDSFHKEMLAIYDKALEVGYNAIRFRTMVHTQGGLCAAKQLLQPFRPGVLPEGLENLWELGRLDLTMEALIINEKWESLFTIQELGEARKRLDSLGYKHAE